MYRVHVKRLVEWLPLPAFVLSLGFLAFLTGFFVSTLDLPPAGTLNGMYEDSLDLWEHWRNDLGMEPDRLLVPAPIEDAATLEVLDPDRIAQGMRLIAELTPQRSALAGIRLIDRAGAELHYWPVDYGLLAPGGESPSNVFLHGVAPLDDGSMVVNFDNGEVLARIDSCGTPIWVNQGRFHHAVDLTERGTLWTWQTVKDPDAAAWLTHPEFLIELDVVTGEPLRRISLADRIIAAHGLYGRFAIHSAESMARIDYEGDAFHPNDVEELTPALAPAFPMFAAGDLLVSFRAFNMIAVLDPDSGLVKWSMIGPWHRQHDPDFLPDGTVSVYDNRMGLGSSAIRRVDPEASSTWISYEADPPESFYSYRRGKHQTLQNGNVLIVESERGRVLEVAPDGETVWIYTNRYDATRNGLVSDAMLLPEGFFAGGVPSCTADRGPPESASPSG